MSVKPKLYVIAGSVLAAVVGFAIAGSHRTSAAASRSASRFASNVEVPKFVVDPSWPHIPNAWTLGQVSSTATDPDSNVWIIHRPGSVKPGVKTGPPVMEFDQAGNYIQGWGGQSGDGYTWPSTEHGITVDYKGNVWISGNGNDDQVLKFTKDGKFIMQVGHPARKKTNADTTSLWKPADVFVYPKTNEIFVADGYGNKRVIVFDADTGGYKRMWGAFGNIPTDDPPRPPALTGEAARAAAAEEEAKRTLATGFDPADPGPAQFVPPVHQSLERRARICSGPWRQARAGVHGRRQIYNPGMDRPLVPGGGRRLQQWQHRRERSLLGGPGAALLVRCQQESRTHLGARPQDAPGSGFVRAARHSARRIRCITSYDN